MSRFAENTNASDVAETKNNLLRSASQTNCPPLLHKQQCNNNHQSSGYSECGSGPKRSSSGLLSIFKWFKKSSDSKHECQNSYDSSSTTSSSSSDTASVLSQQNTPTYPLSRNQSAASVDSLFSTATVASFTYVPPAVYHPYGSASVPEKLIAAAPETNTHKNRMKQLEKHRERDKNLTLRKKYKLFSYESVKNKSSSAEKKNKSKNNKKGASVVNRDYSELSLPLIKCQDKSTDDAVQSNNSAPSKSSHRRTVSDSSKDKKAGAYCHVKGKRRAPPPPVEKPQQTPVSSPNNTLTRRMKRQAPQPPENKQNIANLTPEQKDLLIENIAKLQNNDTSSPENNKLHNSIPDVICNDSLKIESGILKPVKETQQTTGDTKPENKKVNASPISPKPWYKRTLSGSRDSGTHSAVNFKKDVHKHKSEDAADPFSARYSGAKENASNLKFSNMLSRFSISSDERKKDENRKSGISMLANISELDREAAMIVQQEQFREQARLEAKNESYYSPSSSQNDVPSFLQQQQQGKHVPCKKGSARELISKFNALTSATRISVNSALFSSKEEGSGKNSRRFSYQASEKESKNDMKNKFSPFAAVSITPPMKRSIFKLEEFTEEKEEEQPPPLWKVNDQKNTNFEPKVINTPPNLLKYFEPQKSGKGDLANLEKRSAKKEANDVKKEDGWTCTRCTLENGRMDVKCIVCGMWKPFGKATNIEKYLAPTPAQKENAAKNSSKETPVKTSAEENDKKMYTTETVLTETVFNSSENNQNLENETKMARTFAENVFKAFENKAKLENNTKNENAKENAIVSSVTVIEPELSLEELRKVRVARFSQNLEDVTIKTNEDSESKNNNYEHIDKESNTELAQKPAQKPDAKENNVSNKLLSEEQKRLRQMLKEMRDSLPKTNTDVNTSRKSTLEKDNIKEDVELKIVEDKHQPLKSQLNLNLKPKENIEQDVSKGAIPKIKKPIIVDEILKNQNQNNKVITAFIVTKETTYENIKVRKENMENGKPIKVSAGSQTPQYRVTTKPPAKSESILPLSVEEMCSPKTTITRVGSFGKGTFELIRAKDFAGISSTVTTPDSPLYANLPATIEALESPPKSSQSNLTSQQSMSSSEEELLSVQLSDPEGIKDFKATLKQDKHNANTLAINRLLRRLETAIASGQHIQAARLAKDLARLKVNCSVTRQKKVDLPNTKFITADMYVEDQVTHQGPIPLKVYPEMTIADLKQKVAQEFEIPSHVQRWILDRQLASDDDNTLNEFNINFDGCPMFLYLVAPDGEYEETLKRAASKTKTQNLSQQSNPNQTLAATNVDLIDQSDSDITEEDECDELADNATAKTSPPLIVDDPTPLNMWRCPLCTLLNALDRPGCEACSTERPRSVEPKQKNYLQLMDLDNTDLVLNIESFECQICLMRCQIGDGVILRECLHTFCKLCLAQTIEYTEEAEIKCPYRDNDYACDLALQEREVKALVTKEVYEQHLALSVAQAENKIDNAFHCKTPDCRGWCIYEDNVNEFLCPVCKANNCLTCQVIHEGLNCKQYQQQLNENSESNLEARRTRDFLDEMVTRGEAMICPTCQVVLMKKWGCDWLRCSMCKTEICWVTRGPRWGPQGKGDVSGGCKCGVNGIKCHPKCTYCH